LNFYIPIKAISIIQNSCERYMTSIHFSKKNFFSIKSRNSAFFLIKQEHSSTISLRNSEKIKIMHTKFVTLAISLARLFSLNFFQLFFCCTNHTPLSMQTCRKKNMKKESFFSWILLCVYKFFSLILRDVFVSPSSTTGRRKVFYF